MSTNLRVIAVLFIAAATILCGQVAASTIDMTLSTGNNWDDYSELTYSAYIYDGTADSWHWNFGDGSTATGASGTHTYSGAGTYEVTLWAISTDSDLESDTITQDISIEEPGFSASADIEVDDDDLKVRYESTTEGAVYWDWDFGDDETSDHESGTHYYESAGDYTITLTARTSDGQEAGYSEKISFYRTPTARYTVDKENGSAPLEVYFTDDSEENPYTEAAIIEWYWEFDDDANSVYQAYSENGDDPDIEFTYEDEGNYFPVLTVTDENGESDSYKIEILVDDDLAPVADFSIDEDDSTSGDAPLTVKFYDESEASVDTGSDIDSWSWEITDEDGNIYMVSSKKNPTFTIEDAGTYTVSLTVTDEDDNSDTITSEDLLEVSSDTAAAFTASPRSGEAPLTVSFSALGGDDIDYYYWYFGDGMTNTGTDPDIDHIYSSAGTYDVKLIVRDDDGDMHTFERDGYITIETPTATHTVTVTETETSVTEETPVPEETGEYGFVRTGLNTLYAYFSEYWKLVSAIL